MRRGLIGALALVMVGCSAVADRWDVPDRHGPAVERDQAECAQLAHASQEPVDGVRLTAGTAIGWWAGLGAESTAMMGAASPTTGLGASIGGGLGFLIAWSQAAERQRVLEDLVYIPCMWERGYRVAPRHDLPIGAEVQETGA